MKIIDNKYSLRCCSQIKVRKNVLLYTAFDWSKRFSLGFSNLRTAFWNLFHINFILCVYVRTRACLYIQVSQEECARLWECVPYGKVYRYNPKHLRPKLNGYGDNGQRKVWSTCGSTHCTYLLTSLSMSVLECRVALRHCLPVMCHVQVLGNPKDNYDTSATFL
jgi:hypothetical protein